MVSKEVERWRDTANEYLRRSGSIMSQKWQATSSQLRATVPQLLRDVEATTPSWLRLAVAAGLGSMVTVFLGWVDTKGDAIKVYLALVGVLVASGASFIGARVINEQSDRRAVRRQIFQVRLRIHRLSDDLQQMLRLVGEIKDARKSRIQEPELITRHRNVACYVRAASIVRSASTPSEFDGILNTDDDLILAEATIETFKFGASRFAAAAKVADQIHAGLDDVPNYVPAPNEGEALESAIEALARADEHFRMRGAH